MENSNLTLVESFKGKTLEEQTQTLILLYVSGNVPMLELFTDALTFCEQLDIQQMLADYYLNNGVDISDFSIIDAYSLKKLIIPVNEFKKSL
jgi:hypothetical protein